MNCSVHSSELNRIFAILRSYSFEEKVSLWMREEFLGELNNEGLKLRDLLNNKAAKLQKINEELEKITWLDDLDEECLMLVNDVISYSKDLYLSLARQFFTIESSNFKSQLEDFLAEYKESLDNLKEIYEDLESVFFHLPKMKDFVETTKKLSLL